MKNEKSNETTAQINASTQTPVAEKPWDVMGITEAEYLDRETERLEREMKAEMEPQVKVSDFPKQEGDPLETDGYHYVVDVTREGTEKDGKVYYNYSFYQKLFGSQSLRCDLVATLNDVGAYSMLSAMFADVASVPLYARQGEIRDDVTGKRKYAKTLIYKRHL